MLTRDRLKRGEGQLEAFNPEIQRRSRKQEMASPRKLGPYASEDNFFEAFQLMKAMVEELYHERGQQRVPKVEEGESSVRAEGGGEGGGPSEPSSPSSSSSTNEASVHSSKDKQSKRTPHVSDIPLLKLDVKFDFPMYDGEINAKKLDNWVRQLEVYCRIQKITEDNTKIQLASLWLGGTTLIWWESKTQEDLKKSGKIISSWNDFVTALKKQFYPLAYMQHEMMNWKSLKQAKGQNVQSYTQEFRKKALMLGIPLYTQETLLKYIGGLHTTILNILSSCLTLLTSMKFVYKQLTLSQVEEMSLVSHPQNQCNQRKARKRKRET
jgi:hypothetical protein